jgi:hypothetical protein
MTAKLSVIDKTDLLYPAPFALNSVLFTKSSSYALSSKKHWIALSTADFPELLTPIK